MMPRRVSVPKPVRITVPTPAPIQGPWTAESDGAIRIAEEVVIDNMLDYLYGELNALLGLTPAEAAQNPQVQAIQNVAHSVSLLLVQSDAPEWML